MYLRENCELATADEMPADLVCNGYIGAEYKTLVETFGEPAWRAPEGEEHPFTVAWYVKFDNGVVARINDCHDPKEHLCGPQVDEDGEPIPIEEYTSWQVCHNNRASAVRLIADQIPQRPLPARKRKKKDGEPEPARSPDDWWVDSDGILHGM